MRLFSGVIEGDQWRNWGNDVFLLPNLSMQYLFNTPHLRRSVQEWTK